MTDRGRMAQLQLLVLLSLTAAICVQAQGQVQLVPLTWETVDYEVSCCSAVLAGGTQLKAAACMHS